MIASRRSSLLPGSSRWIRLVILAWITVPAVLGMQILIGSQARRSSQPPELIQEAKLPGPVAVLSGLRTQSCSTSNCHGSLTPDLREDAIRSDEYFVWLNDPHAQAYRTLFGEKSRAIFQRLGVADEQLRPLEGQADRFHAAWANCLACHETNSQGHRLVGSAKAVGWDQRRFAAPAHHDFSMFSDGGPALEASWSHPTLKKALALTNSQLSLSAEATDHPALSMAEGVSCESCHGNAQDWLHRHYRPEWKALSREEKRELGHIPGEDVAARTSRCVSCHVGSSGGDVNHDLIAAGHPALRFESVWYQSRLPQHWKPGRRAATARIAGQTQQPPDTATAHPTRDWLIGQLVTASAGLEQLERRASGPSSRASWPEFAEDNCFACHHDLRGNSWRRDRGIPGLAALGTKKSRLSVPWGNWNLELIPILADQFGSRESQDVSEAFGRLRLSFGDGPMEVVNHSRVARRHLEAWLPAVSKLSESDATRMLQQIGRSDPERLISSWDRTATLVLGFAAPFHASHSIPEPLKFAMTRVRFPGDPTAFDSPQNFRSASDEQSLTANQWIELLRQLAELVPEH